ncbi:MAG: pitrilysin family protein [Nanoarchaeota archaeon]|nr:pitrilysin family protein [Nanoarchaeota archaeon]
MEKDFKLYEFQNGFRLACQITPTNTIFGNLRINHGALHEKEGEEGIAHFLEHMFIEGGTEKYTPKEQANISGKFGYTNAFTSRDRTIIPWGMIPSDLEDYLDMACQMTFCPRLNSTVLEQQREVVLREIARTKCSPDFEDKFKFYWPSLTRDRDHTYFVLGEEEVIRNVTEEKLRNFHRRGYNPNNMILMLSGDLPSDIVNLVAKYFADKKMGESKPFEFAQVPFLDTKTIKYSQAKDLLNKDNYEESNSQLMFGVIVPDESHLDGVGLSVAADILGRSRTNGLKKRIRSDEGIAYEIGSFYHGDRRLGHFGVNGKVHAKRQERAIDIIFEELEKMKQTTFDEDEVLRAKSRVAYKITNGLEKNFLNFVNVDPVNVGVIAKMDYALDGRVPIKEQLTRIEQVTPSTIRRVSNEYLPSNRETDNYVLLVRDPLGK